MDAFRGEFGRGSESRVFVTLGTAAEQLEKHEIQFGEQKHRYEVKIKETKEKGQ